MHRDFSRIASRNCLPVRALSCGIAPPTRASHIAADCRLLAQLCRRNHKFLSSFDGRTVPLEQNDPLNSPGPKETKTTIRRSTIAGGGDAAPFAEKKAQVVPGSKSGRSEES
ncbi:hypothetical protein FVF58_34740 [Paraburkholderia panacisoli]|uniref:Uncharacterized protein n=1 Tax=Paraburkholderia panacisoli TaxID=2603818 RepID=A0A5B0GKK4_9BURK|nr:hypothetical protein [Paraburkholderia panacisoli]KAA1003842.1 hypothetical protein FVF58_34740 [Paraburkholderia panacisoli]